MSRQASATNQAAAVQDLREEISFQRTLLRSLDQCVDDREEVEKAIKSEIRLLEKQLKDIFKSNPNASTSNSSSSFTQNSSNTPNNNNTSSSDSAKMNNPFGPSPRSPYSLQSNEQQHQTKRESMRYLSSTSSTPSSVASMAELNLPTRKRSHSRHLDTNGVVPFKDNKSRRTSPSPYHTAVTTPSDSSGDEIMCGSVDQHMIDLQKQEEKRLEQQKEQQKLDEEFARSLSTGSSGLIRSAPPREGSAYSAFDRMSGIRPQPSSSSSSNSQVEGPKSSTQNFQLDSSATRRTLPGHWVKPDEDSKPVIKSEARSSTFGNSSRQYPGSIDLTKDRTSANMDSKLSESMLMPGAYREDSSNASDSDIEIIDSSDFKANDKRKSSFQNAQNQRRYQKPSYTQDTINAGNTAIYRANNLGLQHAGQHRTGLQQAMGNQTSRPWMIQTASHGMIQGPQGSMNNVGPYHPIKNNTYDTVTNNFAYSDTQMAAPHSTYSLPDPHGTNNMHSSYIGPSMHTTGLGYTMNNVPSWSNLAGPSQQSMAPAFDDLFDNPFSTPFTDKMASQVEYVMNDPRKTAQEIQELLQNIKTEVEIPVENREGTPEGLKYPLYEHQKIALAWLKSMETGTNKGGILADDMGLGKTISSLALLLSRPSTDRNRKTTLIVGPVALVRQWEREIRTKTILKHRLSTHMAHGTKKLGWDQLRDYDVVLTTYGTLGSELSRLEKYEEEMRQRGIREPDSRAMAKTFPFLGPRSRFYRVILDEAQCIKNRNTKAARAACRIEATTRFCLTGTPMMNNITELYSLIKFLGIRPYNSWNSFNKEFGCLTKGSHGKRTVEKSMERLQAVLKAILLRRTKTSLIDGKPIIVLPPKVEEVQHVVFNSDEQEFYKALENRTQVAFNKYKKAGTVGKNYSNVLVLLLRLRQCCCHPHLIIDLDEEAPSGAAELSSDAMLDLAKTLTPEVVGRLLAADGFECPVCYDVVPNPSIVIPCGHDTCPECLTKISEQAVQQNVQNGNEAGGPGSCPTCRGKIDMTKVIDYNAFKKAHVPSDESEDKIATDDGDSNSDDSDTDSDTDSDSDDISDVDDDGNLVGFIVPDGMESEDEAEEGDDEDEEVIEEQPKSKKKRKEKRSKDKKGKGKKQDKKKQHLSIAMMKKEASRSAEGRKKYMRYLRKNWVPSAKVDKCVELLEKFQNQGEKTIIFSQFVALLDLLQVPIEKKGWNCERYDGGMNSQRRNDAIVRFTENPNCKIMLISLKAGNAGLNLVAASRVIILDPFWNPFVEMQAVDRAYRIGQMKPVEVHRILVQGTVEDRILELQRQKKALVDAALDEGAMRSVGRLDERQLAFLFGV